MASCPRGCVGASGTKSPRSAIPSSPARLGTYTSGSALLLCLSRHWDGSPWLELAVNSEHLTSEMSSSMYKADYN